MRLGDLLLRVKRVTEEDIARALERQATDGGRLGDNLVAIGAISQKDLEAFIHKIPPEPSSIKATGLDESDLLGLLMRLIYSLGLESIRQFVDAIKLPYILV